MKIGIMQPYFMPYIGYFQLIGAADRFVVYDNIKYTKKGWINRNRFLQGGSDALFSLPLKKGSDYLDVVDRELSADFHRDKLLNQLKGAYARAPHFEQTITLLEQILHFNDRNLFRFLHNSIVQTCRHLGIQTQLCIASEIAIDHEQAGQDKVIALCKALHADTYINAIGGTTLYDRDSFKKNGIDLKFIKTKPIEYKQFDNQFVPSLSIVDVLMFNSIEQTRTLTNEYFELI